MVEMRLSTQAITNAVAKRLSILAFTLLAHPPAPPASPFSSDHSALLSLALSVPAQGRPESLLTACVGRAPLLGRARGRGGGWQRHPACIRARGGSAPPCCSGTRPACAAGPAPVRAGSRPRGRPPPDQRPPGSWRLPRAPRRCVREQPVPWETARADSIVLLPRH